MPGAAAAGWLGSRAGVGVAAHSFELPAGLAGNQLVAHGAGAPGGLGVAVPWPIDREPAHQGGFHHGKAVVAHVAVGPLAAQFRHVDRQEGVGFADGPGLDAAVAAAACTGDVDEEFRTPIAVEVFHLHAGDGAVDLFLDGRQGFALLTRLDHQLPDGSAAGCVHLEADPLQGGALLEWPRLGGGGQGGGEDSAEHNGRMRSLGKAGHGDVTEPDHSDRLGVNRLRLF